MVACACYVHPLCTSIWNVSRSICYVFGCEPYNCSMNMVSKQSCMVTRFLKRSWRWLWFQNGHAWWLGLWNGHAAWIWFQHGHAWWLGFWNGHADDYGFKTVMHGDPVSKRSCSMGSRVSERSCTMAMVLKQLSMSTKGFSFSFRLVSLHCSSVQGTIDAGIHPSTVCTA